MIIATQIARLRWASCLAMLAAGLASHAAPVELNEEQLLERLNQPKSALRSVMTKIEETITAGDASYLAGLIDADQVLGRAVEGFKGKDVEMVRGIFCDGTKRAWADCSPAKDYAGNSFRFLRTRTFEKRAGVLFRSESDVGALNYYVFVLSEDKPSDYRVADIFTVGLNEFTSQALRRTFSHLLASFSSDAAYANELGKSYVDNLQGIADLSKAMREGKYSQALSIWDRLPEKVAHERGVLMLRVDAAERVSPEDRMSAMEDWLKTFPDEMGLPLKIADYYITEKRWLDAERVLRSVLSVIGGDSRLMFQVGQVNYKLQQDKDARGNWVKDAGLSNDVSSSHEKAAAAEKP